MAPVRGMRAVSADVAAARDEKAGMRLLLVRESCPTGVYFSVPQLDPLPRCLALV